MSRIGRLPIPVPSGVDVAIDGRAVTVKGPKGALPHRRRADRDRAAPTTARCRSPGPTTSGAAAPLHGLSRTLIANMVTGVTDGYDEEARDRRCRLPGAGPGQRPRVHPRLQPPGHVRGRRTGITFAVETPTRFSVSGIDKQQVGEVAANIRKLRKPEPYKGKGIRYAGEQIRRKVGKAGK